MNHFSTYTDNALMQAIQAHQEQAFAELYQRYGRQMFRFFYRMLWQDTAKAEDFTQELFIKIIERPAAYDPARPFPTWLYTLAHNLCKNEFRRQSRAPVELTNVFKEEQSGSHFDVIDRQLVEKHLRAAINALPDSHRQCFILRYQEEIPLRDIADITGCPEGTVKSRLHYAVQKVASDMQNIWGKNIGGDVYKHLVVKNL